ncbi:MAG: SGNH/GDSL hydrolase family protein [Lachnospiraceae bacterium]|nr:SGNH/GDSL hydrolase family protein [Lachnospiraceae bacterium]
MKLGKKIAVVILSVLPAIVIFFAVQRLVEPKYADDILEGNFTAEYYEETTDHDVIMIGDCEVYENFDPMYLWKNYGITSYIRGNAQQLAWQSYYMLEDTLRHEKPQVVIYNVQELTYGKPQREEYNRMTLDKMKWSGTKVEAIKASMCKGENFIDYVFPILRYHSRITELSKNDFKYFADARKVTHNGYYMRIDVLPVSESDVADPQWLLGEQDYQIEEDEEAAYDPWDDIDEEGSASRDEETDADESNDPWDDIDEEMDDAEEAYDPWDDIEEEMDDVEEAYDPWDDVEEDNDSESEVDETKVTGNQGSNDGGVVFGDMPMKYLEKMRTLCEKNDIQFILIKAPSLAPRWFDTEDAQVVEYAEENHLPYINYYDLLEETGIDYETDTYDGGLHMNLSGAEKLSKHLGSVLTNEYGVKDHRGDSELKKVYDEKYRFYEDMKKRQQEELDKYGEIRSY